MENEHFLMMGQKNLSCLCLNLNMSYVGKFEEYVYLFEFAGHVEMKIWRYEEMRTCRDGDIADE